MDTKHKIAIGAGVALVLLIVVLRRASGGGSSGSGDTAAAYQSAAQIAAVNASANQQLADTAAAAALGLYNAETERRANEITRELTLSQITSDSALEGRRIDAYTSAARDVTQAQVEAARYAAQSELALQEHHDAAQLEIARLESQSEAQHNADLLALERYQLQQQALNQQSAQRHETTSNVLGGLFSTLPSILDLFRGNRNSGNNSNNSSGRIGSFSGLSINAGGSGIPTFGFGG